VGLAIGMQAILSPKRAAKSPINYTVHVMADDTTRFLATVLAPSGLNKSDYKAVAEGIISKYVSGRQGVLWVFDDAEAEKLQWVPLDVELTPQQQARYDAHLRAMANYRDGTITALEAY